MATKESDFKTLYDDYSVLVYNVALNYLQSVEDAEEISQDVFIQLHTSLHKFQEKSTLKTWIYRITINKCLDFIKHKNSQKRFFYFWEEKSKRVRTPKYFQF